MSRQGRGDGIELRRGGKDRKNNFRPKSRGYDDQRASGHMGYCFRPHPDGYDRRPPCGDRPPYSNGLRGGYKDRRMPSGYNERRPQINDYLMDQQFGQGSSYGGGGYGASASPFQGQSSGPTGGYGGGNPTQSGGYGDFRDQTYPDSRGPLPMYPRPPRQRRISKRKGSNECEVHQMKKKKGVKHERDTYQTRVITYIAVCLSLQENIENYTIYSDMEVISLFEDVIFKIWFKNKPEPYCYLCQIKHRDRKINFKREKHNLHEYVNTIKSIIDTKDTIIFLRDVPVNNIKFWFYSNNGVDDSSVYCENYKLMTNQNCTCLFHPLLHEECCQLIVEGNNFHFMLKQPHIHKIEDEIKNLNVNFTTIMTEDLNKYIDKYFDSSEIRGLTKTIFETELLRIHLSNIIVKPEIVSEINENQAKIWNEICLSQKITIVEATNNIETCIFGCFLYKIKELYDYKLDWKDLKFCGEQFGKNFNIQKFKESSLSKDEKHWNTVPDSLHTLIIEMWKVGDLPLLLKSTEDIPILNKYQHLKKRFIIIGDVKKICRQIEQFNEVSSFPIHVFTDVASIKAEHLRDELLKKLTVSLQGRKPTSLYIIIDGNSEAMKEVTASRILHLIKKRSLYLQEKVLDKTERVIYIVITDETVTGCKFNFEKDEYEINERIECNISEIEGLEEKIKTHTKLRHYKRCRIRINNGKYEPLIHDQVDEFMKRFAVDQDDEGIYGMGDHKLAPVIGERLERSETSYIQRYLSTTSLNESILEARGGRIVFLSGNLSSLTENKRNGVITECDYKKINEKLQRNETVLIDAGEIEFEKYWSEYSSKELLYLRLEDGYLELIRHSNCHNLQEYISPERRKFEESKLFEKDLHKIIISGEPGIGKSSLLKSLAENYNESNFVLFCNFSDYRTKLQEENAQLLKYPLEFIFNESKGLFYKSFLQKIFDHHRKNGKMILFLDSFDEVLPHYKDQVLSILDEIASLNMKFIISSRTHADGILVEKLKIQQIKIENLNQEDVKNYLKEEKLMEVDFENILQEFLTNLLYLQFLILLYQEDRSMFTEIDPIDLYERFIYKKVERYHKKYKEDYNPNVKPLIDETLKYQRTMALWSLFRHEVLKIGNDYDICDMLKEYTNLADTVREQECRLGFIKYFDKGSFPVFSHQTIAEFLAAQWIRENLAHTPLANKLHVEIIKNGDYYFRNLYDNIICQDLKLHKAVLKYNSHLVNGIYSERDIRNSDYRYQESYKNIICKDFLLSTAVLKEDIHLIRQLCREGDGDLEKVDKSGRTALHLAFDLEIMEIIMEHMKDKGVSFARADSIMKYNWIRYHHHIYTENKSYGQFLKDELISAARNNLKNYAEYLLDIEKVSPCSHSLELAAELSCVDLLKILVAHGADISKKDKKDKTILHYAVRNSRPDVIRYVLDMTDHINQKTSDFGQTPLHLACKCGNVFAVNELLKDGADPNVTNRYGQNSLHCAMFSYDMTSEAKTSIISSLIEHNINVDQISSKGGTLLHYACEHKFERGILDILKDLLEKYIDVRNRDGHTPFHIACLKGQLEWVEHLLKEHPNVITPVDNKGNTCLHLAARLSSKSVISLLAEKMANLEVRNNRDEAPLHISVNESAVVVTEFLLERGHDPNLFDKDGNTPLHVCIKEFNSYYKTRLLTRAIKMLLSKNAKMNLKNFEGHTPLHLAARKSCVEAVINALLDRFDDYAELIDLTGKDETGNTLLHYACKNNYQRMVDCLLKKIGTHDIVLKNDEGNTCLHLTANTKRETLFFILIETMAFDEQNHLQIKNNRGKTLLHTSVENNSPNITKFLLGRGHDPNLFDEEGNTPLHFAIQNNDPYSFDILVKNGADVNACNKNLETPLHNAVKRSKNELLEKLLQKGVDLNAQDIDGNTPLHVAMKTDNRDSDGNSDSYSDCDNYTDSDSDIYNCKMLVKFGADPNIRNKKGETALDIAKSLDREELFSEVQLSDEEC